MKKYNTKEVFDRYKENNDLTHADIFHLYDTGKECAVDNSGYVDSRHFKLVAFNTKTMEKCNLGRHDGIQNIGDAKLNKVRVYADGSFFISLDMPVLIDNFQCVILM